MLARHRFSRPKPKPTPKPKPKPKPKSKPKNKTKHKNETKSKDTPRPRRKDAAKSKLSSPTPLLLSPLPLPWPSPPSSKQQRQDHQRDPQQSRAPKPNGQAHSPSHSRRIAAPQQVRRPEAGPSDSRYDNLPVPSLVSAQPDHETFEPPIRASSTDSNDTLQDQITSKFDDILSSIDGETFTGDEDDLVLLQEPQVGLRGGWGSRSRAVSEGADRVVTSAVLSTSYFAKATLYANSKLPSDLAPLHLHMPAWPLVCLAAQYSWRAYNKPVGKEREAFVNADWRMGTKAMMIKSVPMDNINCIVFAIRGSQTFMDWAVNLNSAPVSPGDFLDDPGNLCHHGFLSVARKMIRPVAARLRSLLEEDPSRSTCSLLMTGHSAGGAVASLLYAHMLAQDAQSELNLLTGCFKRVHCLTFGTPPISLLPLSSPPIQRHRKSLFMSFINEGDPVPRADKAYVRSLLNLYASTPPGQHASCPLAKLPELKPRAHRKATRGPTAPAKPVAPQHWVFKWNVPPGTLSNAGRLIVLRELNNDRRETADDIKADITCDQQLREVVFGDPVMHMMSVYARRVEVLATKAVTARIWG